MQLWAILIFYIILYERVSCIINIMTEGVDGGLPHDAGGVHIKDVRTGLDTVLAHAPTDELLKLDRLTPIFRNSRICSYFPQVVVTTFFLYEEIQEQIAQGMKKELVSPLYRDAIAFSFVKAFYHDPKTNKNLPLQDERDVQVEFPTMLRQGVSFPLGLVIGGPYAGLIVNPMEKGEMFMGVKPEKVKGVIVQRLMNDGALDKSGREVYKVEPSIQAIDPHATAEEVITIIDLFDTINDKVQK